MARGATLFRARWLVVDADRVLENAGLWVGRGRVLALCPRLPRRVDAGRTVDLGDVAIAPGLIDAHAHLELGGLAAADLPAQDFVEWVRALVAARRAWTRPALARAAREGADALLRSGTTAVGDVDSSGAATAALSGHPLRVVAYREWLDLDEPGRRLLARRALRGLSPGRRRRRLVEGLSPHAPYSVGPELLAALARRAARAGAPLAVHWAETQAEGEWLEGGQGPFAALFARSPRRAGLDLLQEAGLLGPRTALIHGNDPRRDEPARIARAGAVLVHCPGSHAYFDRDPFPLEVYRRAGVCLALGTDSAASNADLDMRREMSLARRAFPDLEPREVWRWATEGGARALGMGGRIGVLRPGAQADFVAFEFPGGGVAALWEHLTASIPPLAGVWIGGRRADGSARGTGRLGSATLGLARPQDVL